MSSRNETVRRLAGKLFHVTATETAKALLSSFSRVCRFVGLIVFMCQQIAGAAWQRLKRQEHSRQQDTVRQPVDLVEDDHRQIVQNPTTYRKPLKLTQHGDDVIKLRGSCLQPRPADTF